MFTVVNDQRHQEQQHSSHVLLFPREQTLTKHITLIVAFCVAMTTELRLPEYTAYSSDSQT